MKRLINSTTILSMALYIVPPFAAQAQDFPKVTIDGTEVICLPDKKTDCPEGAFCVVVKNPKNCESRATEALAAAATEAAATDQAAVDQAAADKAAAEKAAADADAAEVAAANQAAIDAAAAEKEAADKAAAKASKADKAAADKAAEEAAAAEQAAKDQAAADQAAADKAAMKAAKKAAKEAADAEASAAVAAEVAATEATAAETAATTTETTEVEATTTETTTAEVTTTDGTTADAGTADTMTAEAGLPSVTVDGRVFICLPDKATECPEGAECVVAKTVEKCEDKAAAKVADMADGTTPTEPATDPVVVTEAPAEDAAAVAAAQAAAEAAAAVAAADPTVTIIDVPTPTEEAVATLEEALDTTVSNDDDAVVAPEVDASGTAVVTTDGTLPADVAPSEDATVTTEVVTEADSRASTEEFAKAPTTVAPGKKTGLSDFEKVGLLALGALVIGAIINGNKQVVSNTGDRVVVRQPDGTYQVYKDDNALLREPGATVRTETYRDGSTRTIVTRADGSQVVTIRDATGRVLQRVAYDRNGRGTVLIDDLQPEERVDVSTLPRVNPTRNQISLDDTDAELRAQMAADDAAELGRKFSLRQIRNIPEVRHLAPTIDVNNITFATGSSAIQESEAKKLNRLGKLIIRLIHVNPGEVFLIEGHTDAVGSAASNLALSDRRAESVAKALTEYFDVPPENLVVQGYGESELKVETLGNEEANRRVAVRIITGLLRQTAN